MPVDFVAEVSSNHNRDLERCLKFVSRAAAIGCSAVKFQLFKIDELFAPEILQSSEAHRQRKKWELPLEFLPELKNNCQKNAIQFACTPFYLKAVEELLPHVDFFKIASYELLWKDLLVECAMTGKPVVLSTGMASMAEIRGAVETLRGSGCDDLTLLHCVSGYPVSTEETNLSAIKSLRGAFDVRVGWSDHSVCPAVIYRAVHHWDASMIEFHLDLEGMGAEFESGHCWLLDQAKAMIKTTNLGFESDGSGIKEPMSSELPERNWRADPDDGLRPLSAVREILSKKESLKSLKDHLDKFEV